MKIEHDAMKCVKCGGWANPAKLRLDGEAVRGWKCACGEDYIHGEDADRLLVANKARRGLLKTKVCKVGNSYSIRIPKPIVDALKLKGKTLSILLEPKRLVLVE
ncbi:MAG: AbrB/MazE/SpoVT family DNA-binding domain-containing protein [Candidatus Burarchaeum sp.]|nr:AbrB/MazE/SpoVT family DNA-binding domain-containing protein [Candidatus Burarchaeum sp.]MDO8339182.1 AbrB/MazE/SpoVT family DNA-binding domain-containing protein [Candidatus Burarchaeum sp.]